MKAALWFRVIHLCPRTGCTSDHERARSHNPYTALRELHHLRRFYPKSRYRLTWDFTLRIKIGASA